MSDKITPEEFEKRVKKIINDHKDEEIIHIKYDRLCAELLIQLGYGKGANLLRDQNIEFWYS